MAFIAVGITCGVMGTALFGFDVGMGIAVVAGIAAAIWSIHN